MRKWLSAAMAIASAIACSGSAFAADAVVGSVLAVRGAVYVAWDGAQHAFLLEPTVHPDYRRQGIGTELVRRAVAESRAAGCQWLHVDFEADLASFYAACGFTPTTAGLIRL